jgi:hypothetical protein
MCHPQITAILPDVFTENSTSKEFSSIILISSGTICSPLLSYTCTIGASVPKL